MNPDLEALYAVEAKREAAAAEAQRREAESSRLEQRQRQERTVQYQAGLSATREIEKKRHEAERKRREEAERKRRAAEIREAKNRECYQTDVDQAERARMSKAEFNLGREEQRRAQRERLQSYASDEQSRLERETVSRHLKEQSDLQRALSLSRLEQQSSRGGGGPGGGGTSSGHAAAPGGDSDEELLAALEASKQEAEARAGGASSGSLGSGERGSGEADDAIIAHLIGMGFPLPLSRRAALAVANRSAEAAAEWVLMQGDAKLARPGPA